MQEAMSEDDRSFEQKVEEELAQMDPAVLEHLRAVEEEFGKIDLTVVNPLLVFIQEEITKIDSTVVERLRAMEKEFSLLFAENMPLTYKLIDVISDRILARIFSQWSHEHENTNFSDDTCEQRGVQTPEEK